MLASACAAPTPPGAQVDRRPRVVTTVAPITNIVRNVAGAGVQVDGIVPEGVDSHTFEPTPSDARLLGEADLVIVNGLHLEQPTVKLAEANAKPGREMLFLADKTITREEWVFDFSFPHAQGDPNPHLWLNVAHAMTYASLAEAALARLDPPGQSTYGERSARYRARLATLDKAISTAVTTVPPDSRRLLTYHDSWPYFAKRYGFVVIGAAQPADFSEPSAREVGAIIDQIRTEKVPAIFGSEVFPSRVLEQIARETGVAYVDTLRDDDLPGPVGSVEHTYIGMMLHNVRTMVIALGGTADALDGIEPRDLP